MSAENFALSAENNPFIKMENTYKITVNDTGVGIQEEHLPKIFDPYFTTKEEGSGLGLATAYSIIKTTRDILWQNLPQEVGTTFYIHLPASKRKSVEWRRLRKNSFPGRKRFW